MRVIVQGLRRLPLPKAHGRRNFFFRGSVQVLKQGRVHSGQRRDGIRSQQPFAGQGAQCWCVRRLEVADQKQRFGLVQHRVAGRRCGQCQDVQCCAGNRHRGQRLFAAAQRGQRQALLCLHPCRAAPRSVAADVRRCLCGLGVKENQDAVENLQRFDMATHSCQCPPILRPQTRQLACPFAVGPLPI